LALSASRNRRILLLAALTIIIVALSVGSVRLDSATSDEPAYIAAGMIKVTAGRLDFFRDQPPLMNSITALPLVIAGYRMPPVWQIGGNHWAIGKTFLYRAGYDGHGVLLLARLPTIALFVGLAFAVYFFVLRHTGSEWSALGAFVLTGFCPNLMAHGRLATVDMALSLFTFIAAALFIAMVERPHFVTAIGVGVATAAAALSKTSGNILAPYFVLVLLIALVMGRIGDKKRLAICAGLALVAAFVFLEVLILAEGSDAYIRGNFPELPRLAVPFAEYLANLEAIRGWYSQGHDKPQFLLGEFSRRGWWYYYPVALALKTTIPALLLIAGSFVFFRKSFPVIALLAFVALFLLVAARGELALGIRYVLPIYPFLYAASAIQWSDARVARRLLILPALLLTWHIAENAIAYPGYLSYFNQSIGSHRNADRFLVDSNLDWGQDLRRLGLWCRENGVKELPLHYFGGGDPVYDLAGVRPIGGYGPGGRPLPKGWFALSRHLYRVSFSRDVSRMNYDDYLRQSRAQLVTTVGGSINVYRIQ
jgi:4-amino-4-deoxy-L-arabinose transferase-like glycosyltransferase